jgi:hypothetical protein
MARGILERVADQGAGHVTNCAMFGYIVSASAPLPAALVRRGALRLLTSTTHTPKHVSKNKLFLRSGPSRKALT